MTKKLGKGLRGKKTVILFGVGHVAFEYVGGMALPMAVKIVSPEGELVYGLKNTKGLNGKKVRLIAEVL